MGERIGGRGIWGWNLITGSCLPLSFSNVVWRTMNFEVTGKYVWPIMIGPGLETDGVNGRFG